MCFLCKCFVLNQAQRKAETGKTGQAGIVSSGDSSQKKDASGPRQQNPAVATSEHGKTQTSIKKQLREKVGGTCTYTVYLYRR